MHVSIIAVGSTMSGASAPEYSARNTSKHIYATEYIFAMCLMTKVTLTLTLL